MTYEDIVDFATNNVPAGMEYGDMLKWLNESIPNWKLMDAEKQAEIKRSFEAKAEPSEPERIAQEIDKIGHEIETVEEMPEEEKGFARRVLDKIKSFLGRLF